MIGPEDRGYFHRYIGLPFETLMLQGSSTRQLALAVAIGVTFGVFPIMGASIPCCFLAALILRAPQPLTHAVNYAVYPLQIPLIFAFVRLGEWILGAPNVSFSPTEVLDLARSNLPKFIEEFGLTCLHAMLAWVLFAPAIFLGTFLSIRPLIVRLRRNQVSGEIGSS
ncbi:MAG: DUF2062 domain-containing protein [Vicinamibacteria bacterium]